MDINATRMTRAFGLFLLLVSVGPICRSQSLDFEVLGLFPKETSELGYADLEHAREQDWFPQFKAQLVPVLLNEFEQYLAAAQMKQTAHIEQVAWSRVTPERETENSGNFTPGQGQGELVAVANGDFDVNAIMSFLDAHKVPSFRTGNFTLYASAIGSGTGNIYFVVVDARTIVFGPLRALERMLSVRAGEEANLLENERMMQLIVQANGTGVLWGVLDSAAGGAVLQRFLPAAAMFPQAQNLLAQIDGFVVSMRAPSDIEINLQAELRSPASALLLSQLVQAGLLYQAYESGSSNPALANILSGISVAPSGNLLQLFVDLSDDQARILIERNTFSSMM